MITEVTLLNATEWIGTLAVVLSYPDKNGHQQHSLPVIIDINTKTARIYVGDVFKNNVTNEASNKICVLQFFYNNPPISSTNPSPLDNATTFSVNVWAE